MPYILHSELNNTYSTLEEQTFIMKKVLIYIKEFIYIISRISVLLSADYGVVFMCCFRCFIFITETWTFFIFKFYIKWTPSSNNCKASVSASKWITSFSDFEHVRLSQILHIREHFTPYLRHEHWELERLPLQEHVVIRIIASRAVSNVVLNGCNSSCCQTNFRKKFHIRNKMTLFHLAWEPLVGITLLCRH